MKRSVQAAIAVVIFFVSGLSGFAQAPMPAVWDGGNGDFGAAKWNGGMTATEVFGDNRISDGAWDVTIGGGSTVTYLAANADDDPTATGPAIRPRSNVGPTTITINGGSTFHQTTAQNGDEDGMWTTFDADLNLDNGTFKRDFAPGGVAQAGGILMLGSWRSVQDQQIDINLTNGGKIQNDGQIWFGADEEHAVGLKVFMTINNGSLDLTGGAFPTSNNENEVTSDWAIFYGRQFADGDGTDMSGSPKGEQYKVNFKGPGTITVDNGIAVYDVDEGMQWTKTDASYEDLWNRGILRSGGVSGGYLDPVAGTITSTGRAFANFFNVTGTPGAANYTLTRKEPTVVTWDGGAGEWNDDAKWNGGQTAVALMGANQAGTTNRGSDGGHAVVIDGSKPGGAAVTFDPNPDTGAGTDFRMRVDNGVSSLTIKNGGTFTINSASDVDGKWTRQGSDLTIEGTGSKYSRTKDGVNSQSGGVLLLGAFNQQQGQEIDVNIRDGGRLENDGQVWFGTDDSSQGLTVNMTIDGGSVDLTGGDNYPLDLSALGIDPDLAFFYAYRDEANGSGPIGLSGETYSINFTGPGTFTVDHSGIYAVTEDETGMFTAAAKTYQQLWADGVLQANGLSGLTGATFGDFFTVTGAHLMDNYTLTSKIGAVGLVGDYNNNGVVDAADYVVWRNGDSPDDTQAGFDVWRANFGRTGGGGAALAGGAAAVPEPSTLLFVGIALAAGLLRRRS